MKLDLDSLKTEILAYLEKENFVIFHGYSRRLEETDIVEWDSHRYPDYRLYLKAAKQAGVKIVTIHHREFTSGHVEHGMDQLEETELEQEDRRRLEKALRELGGYESFTCAIEMSFEIAQRLYFFELRAEWYDEFQTLMDEIDAAVNRVDYEEDEEGPMGGGYYSRN